MSQASTARPPLARKEDVRTEIRRSLTQSASAFNRGDIDTILGAYAPDAVVLPPNSPGVQGMHAIRQLWESLLAAGYRNAAFELDEIQHWGEVALAIGRYNVQVSFCGRGNRLLRILHKVLNFAKSLGALASNRCQRLGLLSILLCVR